MTEEIFLLWLETQFFPNWRGDKSSFQLFYSSMGTDITSTWQFRNFRKFRIFDLFSPKYYASHSTCRRWILQVSKRSLEKSPMKALTVQSITMSSLRVFDHLTAATRSEKLLGHVEFTSGVPKETHEFEEDSPDTT